MRRHRVRLRRFAIGGAPTAFYRRSLTGPRIEFISLAFPSFKSTHPAAAHVQPRPARRRGYQMALGPPGPEHTRFHVFRLKTGWAAAIAGDSRDFGTIDRTSPYRLALTAPARRLKLSRWVSEGGQLKRSIHIRRLVVTLERSAERCPRCGSADVHLSQRTSLRDRFFFGKILLWRAYRCYSCSFRFHTA